MITHLTEAARALRALFLNIVGDTKTEIEEGVTWTTGEIAGLKDVLRKYAPEAVKAAEATGRIIDPMEAIGGLAQSMKEGTLKEQELMEMVSDIGGKLRTSQLLALIQNWDMYNKMLTDTANAVGSADKEIANAMDSWTRKTNVLKNTWTEFIKSGLNSGQIKFFLDALTWIIKHLGTLNGAVIRLGTALAALKLFSTARELTQISKGLLDVKNGASKAARMFTEMGVSAKALNVASGIIGGLTLAWTAYTAIQAEIERKHQEMVQKTYEEAAAAKESSDEILTLYAGLNSAKEGSDELTESAKKLAEALGTDIPEGAAKAGEALTQLTREQLLSALDKMNTAKITAGDEFVNSIQRSIGHWDETNAFGTLFQANWNTYAHKGGQLPEELRQLADSLTSGLATREGSAGYQIFDATTLENALKFHDAMVQISDAVDEYVRRTGDRSALDSRYYKQLQDYLIQTKDTYEKFNSAAEELDLQEIKLRFLDLSSAIRVDSVEAYEKLIDTINLKNRGSDEEREALIALAEQYYPQFAEAIRGSTDAADANADSIAGQTDALYANQKALDKNASAEERAAAAKKDAEASARKFIGALIDENGELTENGIEAMKASSYLADLVNAEIAAQQEAQRANYANMRAQLSALAADAIKAAKAIMAAYAVSESLVSLKRYAIENGATPDVMRAITLLKSMESIENKINATSVAATSVEKYTSSYKPSSGSSGSSGGGSGRTSGSSGGGSGRTSGSSGGGKSSSSSASTEDKKLTALQNRVNLLKSELSLMQERGDSEEAQAAKMREIMAALKNEANYLKSIKGDQITINNLSQEWWSYNNKLSELMDKEAKSAQDQAEALQKALEAQKALNNALKDRSVRYYNAQTGQWEWTANAENVANATKARDEAISAAGYDNLDAWNSYYRIASTMESIRAFADFVNAHPSVSIWDIPGLMQNSYTSNYGGTTNSNIYNFNGFSMSEQQARGTTLYEMALRSRMLALHNSNY